MKLASIGVPLTVLGIALAQGPNRPQGPAPNPQPRMQMQGQPQMQTQQGQPQPRQVQAQQPAADFSALKSYLNLTDAQIRQMQQAREKADREAGEKEKTLRPQIQEKHMALADLMEKDAPDATAVGRAMLEIRGLERQIKAAHEAARTAEINVMTAEQKTKFKAIQDAANLPAATREAQRLGLVPGPPPGPGIGQGMGQGMGPGMMNGPRPRMQGPGMRMGPPQQPMQGPGRMGPRMLDPRQGPNPGVPEGDR